MKNSPILLAIVAPLILIVAPTGAANDLKPETLKAWDDAVQATKSQLEQRVASQQKPFLWIDEVPGRAARVRAGEIIVAPADNGSPRRVAHGLIHDWEAGVFVPNATLDEMLRVMENYDSYQKYFKPRVVKSKLLEKDGGDHKYLLVLMQRSLGVTAAFDTDNDEQSVRIDDLHAYAYSWTTRVQAITDFGKPTERKLPKDTGPGYVWRLASFSRIEQRDGGVYVESELMGMSRGIPAGFRWLVEPLTERLPREYAATTLRQTRDALVQEMKSAGESKPATGQPQP